MRVVEPHAFKEVKHPKKKRKARKGLIVALFLVLAASTGLYSFNNRPTPANKTTKTQTTQSQSSPQTTTATPPAAPVKTFTYCVNVRGISEKELPGFAQKIDWTLNVGRGWSLSNKLAFKKVETGCDFTMWLAAPEYMSSFGGLCDSEWSCRAGNAVVANYEKWQNGSEAWRQEEGSSTNFYQVMVINHEVGHWFGFEHRHCEGPGQPAPVMQQQSIDLEGCTFNPWPTLDERIALQKQLNL